MYLDEGIKELFMAPKQNPKLFRLALDGNKLGGCGFLTISRMFLNPNCRITDLSLRKCELKDDELSAISFGLDKRFPISILNLADNIIRDKGVKNLASHMQQFPYSMKRLDLSNNHISVNNLKF